MPADVRRIGCKTDRSMARYSSPPKCRRPCLPPPRKPKTTGPRARDPGAFKIILTRTNIEGWLALKMLAVENDTTLNAMAVGAFNVLLKKHGKRPSIENPLLD